MKRLRIEHRTGYTYDGPAFASYNEARMLPASGRSQLVISSDLTVSQATSQFGYVDYFGTRVSSFDVLVPHDELTLVATSLVEVRPHSDGPGGATWEQLADHRNDTIALSEQLQQTGRTRPPAEVARLARRAVEQTKTPAESAASILSAIGESIEYVQGVTAVTTSAAQAWDKRKGVCQDIAHIALGALRAVGIPARYVSGYLHPSPDAAIGDEVAGESHAWLEWWDGDWHGYDPTNHTEITDRHVQVGRGRDYGDVPPLRGVYSGEGASHLFVSVHITREA